MKYEIHIGEILDASDFQKKPKHIMIITQDQLAIIEQFATIKYDKELNRRYILNECEFTVSPYFPKM